MAAVWRSGSEYPYAARAFCDVRSHGRVQGWVEGKTVGLLKSRKDASYGIRWLKAKAAGWQGDPSNVGVLGSSTGGHVAELLGMRLRL